MCPGNDSLRVKRLPTVIPPVVNEDPLELVRVDTPFTKKVGVLPYSVTTTDGTRDELDCSTFILFHTPLGSHKYDRFAPDEPPLSNIKPCMLEVGAGARWATKTRVKGVGIAKEVLTPSVAPVDGVVLRKEGSDLYPELNE
jgi:hypothetical protein